MTEISLKWASEDSKYNVEMDSKVWNQILLYCDSMLVRETGGVIIGYYSDDLYIATVKEVSPPPRDSTGTFCTFKRGITGLWKLLADRWKEPIRTYYLGEWHYHPSITVEPSSEDIEQMVTISNSKRFQCKIPIMLIVGKNQGMNRASRFYVFPIGKRMIELFSSR